MRIRKLTLKMATYLLLIIAPFIWLLTTQSGLVIILAIASIFCPFKYTYQSLSGKIIGKPIVINGLEVEYENKTLRVGQLTADWQLQVFAAHDIHGIVNFVAFADNLADQDLILKHVYGQIKFLGDKKVCDLQLHGISMHTPLYGQARVTKLKNAWDIEHVLLRVGKNLATFKQERLHNYSWHIALSDPKLMFRNAAGNIFADGSATYAKSGLNVFASVKTKYFQLNEYSTNDLHAVINLSPNLPTPLVANIDSSKLKIKDHILHNINVKILGDLNNHTFSSNATYDKSLLKAHATGSIANKLWQINDIKLNFQQYQLNGNSSYDFNKNKFAINLQANQENTLSAMLQVNPNKLEGNINIVAQDISMLMQWMPDVTRLKGNFKSRVKISGTIDQPEFISETHLTNVTATLPGYGIKIKPLDIHISSDKRGRFTLIGTGKMRRGPGEFVIKGYIEPFKPNMPNEFSIVGTNVEFINNQTAHLIASSDLKVHYAADAQRVDIKGDIEVQQGFIKLVSGTGQTVKTKDVVFVHEPNQVKNLIKFNPNIYLRIAEGVHFTGFDLDAVISGKLDIEKRNDTLYADGRITIKEGTYALPGQKLTINKGRLLYPAGTLLVNPMLDIKMQGKNIASVGDNKSASSLELMVHGTAQKPIISESGLTGDKDRALSQALLTGSSILSNNILQDKLKISEIGIKTNDQNEINFFDDPSKDKSLKNKDLVLGRPLGNKLYIQYLHSMGEPNQKVRLKYSLNKIWAIGVESGTTGGGADLSFSVERD